MKLYLFILPLLMLFSCTENQSSTKSANVEASSEKVDKISPATAEVNPEIKIEETKKPSATAVSKNSKLEKASKIEIEKTSDSKQQADINKIIANAEATKPTATPKASPKPATKKTPTIQPEAKPQIVTKKEPSKPIAIETTPSSAVSKPAPKKESKISHASFDSYLKKYVSANGNVNYSGMKGDRQPLNNYIAELAKSTPKPDWSRNEKLAYWINAYNAFTIDLILSNYPVSKITDLDGGSPWKVNRIELEGKKYSLDQIENKIIRPQFKEPRIHFAVNCAAKSCPTLMNGAFLPSQLTSQLERQTKKFINNSAFNNISDGSAKVSKIFEWYGEDFGNLRDYINKYSSNKIASGAKIEFVDYDWSLNGK